MRGPERGTLMHNYKITAPGGIRCPLPKKGDGGVVQGVWQILTREGSECYVRCEDPGLVHFTLGANGIEADVFQSDSDLKPMVKGSGIVPWAQELITHVKGRR